MREGSDTFSAITATYGAPPFPYFWAQNQWYAVAPPLYYGIVEGSFGLANFLSALPHAEVNVITHSHGGNVLIWATHVMNRPIRHMINLATPINWDIGTANTGLPPIGARRLAGGRTYSHCQISSTTDLVQFAGSSIRQQVGFGVNISRAAQYGWKAATALLNGDWAGFAYYSMLAAYHSSQAHEYYWSTKIEHFGRTYGISGVAHTHMHDAFVWRGLVGQCATN
jgi:hypothetical protein